MDLILDDLRCQVVGRPAQRVGALVRQDHLGEAEVGDLDVPVSIQQQILRLRYQNNFGAAASTGLKEIARHNINRAIRACRGASSRKDHAVVPNQPQSRCSVELRAN